jgi:hypothetical protein
MLERLRALLKRHPLVRDAVLWALPAILVAMLLRGLLLSYLPYAYWGSDSRSYFSFAEGILDEGRVSLYDKRRYFYPIFLLPVSLLPGPTLQWVAWIQHALGVATLVPLAYCIRQIFPSWRLLIIPATLLYAAMPIFIWYEHELLAEAVFFHAVIWMAAGWIAFAPPSAPLAVRNFWWFFVPLAVLVLTKPAGRFFWPAVLCALLCAGAWRLLKPRHWAALGAALGLTLSIGQDSQGSWLLYTSAFPLTRLNTPLHAEYKAEAADLIARARAQLDAPGQRPDRKDWKFFLKHPEKHPERPLWSALATDEALKHRIYKDLALEGIRSHPWLFLRLALGKIVASANPGEFKAARFLPSYFVERYERQYERDIDERPYRIRRLFGIGAGESIEPYEIIASRIAPVPESPAAQWFHGFVEAYHRAADLVEGTDEDDPPVRYTPLGWWLLAGVLLTFLPLYFRSLGLPIAMGICYLVGTFLVGGENPRFFGPAWGLALLALSAPVDLAVRGAARLFHRA